MTHEDKKKLDFSISKEWCEQAGDLEKGFNVSAGLPFSMPPKLSSWASSLEDGINVAAGDPGYLIHPSEQEFIDALTEKERDIFFRGWSYGVSCYISQQAKVAKNVADIKKQDKERNKTS